MRKKVVPTQLFATLLDCSPPGSSAHGIFQARVLEWGAIAFSILMHIYMEFRKMVTMTNVRQKKKKT